MGERLMWLLSSARFSVTYELLQAIEARPKTTQLLKPPVARSVGGDQKWW